MILQAIIANTLPSLPEHDKVHSEYLLVTSIFCEQEANTRMNSEIFNKNSKLQDNLERTHTNSQKSNTKYCPPSKKPHNSSSDLFSRSLRMICMSTLKDKPEK